MKTLTSTQEAVHRALRQHGWWSPTAPWMWGTLTGTQRIMDALVRKGAAFVENGVYKPIREHSGGKRR